MIKVSKAELVEVIGNRIDSEATRLTDSFLNSAQQVGVRYTYIGNLLPTDVALSEEAAFPPASNMRFMDSFREKKYPSNNFDQFNSILGNVTFDIQKPNVAACVERITGINSQVPDSLLYAGGPIAMTKGHSLCPHIYNSHVANGQYYRTLNLMYYVTPDWDEENVGNLQIWNYKVLRRVTIDSKFNRMILMETSPYFTHSVSKIEVDEVRRCVSSHYFSRTSPTGQEYFDITAFSPPPNQPVERLPSRVDAEVRQAGWRFKPQDLGRLVVYEGPSH